MVFESDANLLDAADTNILSSYRRLNIYSKIWDSLQEKRIYLEEQNAKVVSRIDSLEESIKEFNVDIANLTAEVNKINAQVIDTNAKIDGNKKTIELIKSKIADNTEVLMEYLVYVYKKWEFVSEWNDIDNIKSILLSGENIDELVNDLYFKSIIQVTWKQLVDKHRQFMAELYIKKLELERQENELKVLRKQWILEKNILDDKKEAKERLLTITKWQEDLYQKYIAEKLEDEREIKEKELLEKIKLNNTKKELLAKYGCEFIDIWASDGSFEALSAECQNINKIIYAESRLSGISGWNNPLAWPVAPYAWITSYFRDPEYSRQFGTDHDAIDVAVPQGTEIKAPMDGYVLYIQPPVNNGYAYIWLKHTDGLVTLYGHVTEVNVGLYDFVNKWDVFALSGGEYGTPGAWLLTTWPHLHFVVYENEEYVDPLEYLDLSYVQLDSLPERYEYKYLSDFRSRKWYEYTQGSSCTSGTFCIVWADEVERQKYLLNTYAVWGFRDWNIWIEESVSAGIDPSFMMCVWLAETTLWKYMKSRNNIWNVGNNDRGDTVDFATPRQWIHWMTKTFNNQFLGNYTELQQLSRYGNKTGSIYASSDFNWHNNISKCMSHVKGQYIPDDFQFRIN